MHDPEKSDCVNMAPMTTTSPSVLQLMIQKRLGIAPPARPETRVLAPPKRAPPLPDDDFPSPYSLPVMSEREVMNGLTLCLRGRSPRIPIACVARATGLSRMTLYRVLRSGRASLETRAALSALLTEVADHTVGFERRARKWESVELRPSPPFDRLLPRQDKLVRAEDYVQGACCQTCDGWRFTRVTLHGAPAEYFLCDGCLWWETAGLGARPVEALPRSRNQRGMFVG